MSGIAGIIQWDGAPVAADDLERMMRLMAHRGPDGMQFEIDGLAGLAHARMALRREELKWRAQPVWLPNRSKAIVADARLYNRADLLSRLGAVEWFRDLVSDAEIILALFERYGGATPDLLDGDFAFVVWDAGSRRVFAARDPFGVKPLVYWSRGDRFVFASEPKQILCLPYVPVKPDDLAVGEVLVNRYQDSGRTFYRDVHMLRPAHFLLASAHERREVRHWNPDPERVHSFAKPDDCFEEFRSHLKKAVARRLQIDYPAVADLSGGYDSSAVVVMAAAAYREGAVACPRLETLSALYPGLACDEREYSEAVSEIVPFPRRTYDGWELERCIGAAEDLRRLDAPYLHPPDGESLALAKNLKEAGARIVLTGVCGDEITSDRPILHDLAASGSYWRLARLLWSFQEVRRKPRSRYPLALLRLATPLWLRKGVRAVRPWPPWRAPSWLNGRFASRLEEYFASAPSADRQFPSHTQQTVYDAMTNSALHRALELVERRRAYMGMAGLGLAAALAVVPAQAAEIPAVGRGACGPMDVVFLIDTTGSMGGAIGNIVGDLGTIVTTIQNASGDQERLGLVVTSGLLPYGSTPPFSTLEFDGQMYDCFIPDDRLDGAVFNQQTVGDCIIVVKDLASDTTGVQNAIGNLTAKGGGAIPEITAEALRTVLQGLDQTPDMKGVSVPTPEVTRPDASPFSLTDGWPRLQWNNWSTPFASGARKIVFLVTDALPGGVNDSNQTADDDMADLMAANYGAAGIIIQPVLVAVQICQNGNHNGVLVSDLTGGQACTDGDGVAVDHYGTKVEGIMQAYATESGGTLTKVPFSGVGTSDAIISIIENCGGEPLQGRMTGGGSVFDHNDNQNPRVTHGFTLHCDGGPNNLQVNWPRNRFHMELLTNATCIDDVNKDEQNPVAGFDTITGAGVGRLNGVPGATIEFTFVDDGEPGKVSDTARISINGGADLSVEGTITKGNHQAHTEN